MRNIPYRTYILLDENAYMRCVLTVCAQSKYRYQLYKRKLKILSAKAKPRIIMIHPQLCTAIQLSNLQKKEQVTTDTLTSIDTDALFYLHTRMLIPHSGILGLHFRFVFALFQENLNNVLIDDLRKKFTCTFSFLGTRGSTYHIFRLNYIDQQNLEK